MILETKISGAEAVIDWFSVMAIFKYCDGIRVYLYGQENPIYIELPFDKAKEKFIEAKSRDRFSDRPPQEAEIKSFPLVEAGIYKFSLQTFKTKLSDGFSQLLKMNANFPVKNDIIKTCVENIPGVEKYNLLNWDKYECTITIGRLFDLETIRQQVEQKIKECIES